MKTELKMANEIEEIAKSQNEPKSNVIAKALKIGINQLWKESVLDNYLKGKISKKKAISLVGKSLVLMAEKQKKAVIEDIKWGLSNA